MLGSLDDLTTEIDNFEARPTLEKSKELSEQIDYLMLEDHITIKDRKTLKQLKTRISGFDFNKPANQHLLTDSEICLKQKRMLYDCEKLAISSGKELERQNLKLDDAKDMTYKIDGKLIGSAGLLLTIKRNMQMNTVMLRVVIYTLILIFLVLIMMKVFG